VNVQVCCIVFGVGAVISPCISDPIGEPATTQSVAHHRLPLSLPNAAPSQLAAPHLNSTAQLYNKIQNLKQQRKQTNVPGSHGSKTQHTHSQPSMSTEDSRTVTDLESLYKGQKPLKVGISIHRWRKGATIIGAEPYHLCATFHLISLLYKL